SRQGRRRTRSCCSARRSLSSCCRRNWCERGGIGPRRAERNEPQRFCPLVFVRSAAGGVGKGQTKWGHRVGQRQHKRIDRSDLLARPLFWAIHSFEQARADHWVEEFFGLAPDDLKEFWQRELPSVLPEEPDLFTSYCFPLPLREGCTASVEYEACP